METKQTEVTVVPQVSYPWRRYWARSIDLFIYEILWSAFLWSVFHVGLMGRSLWGNLLDVYVALGLMLFLEPVCLHFLGTTPGKAIFGLQVKHAAGRNLTYSEGLYRTWVLIGSGMGYNIPIYHLVRLWKSFVACTDGNLLPWDQSVAYSIKDTKWYRWFIFIGANIVIFALTFLLYSSGMFPPNRGDLTVAQFAENYNYYEKQLDADFDNIYMNEKGKWTEKKVQGVHYFPIYYGSYPEISFQLEGDYVKGLTLKHEATGRKDFIDSHSSQMALAALAFAGAQEEVGLFSKAPQKILEQVLPEFRSFQFALCGITFTCDIEYSGYANIGHGMLTPIEGSTKYDYHFVFSMEKE